METYKQVLDIEKKYDHKISTAKKQLEKDFEKFSENLKDEEAAIKNDYRKELEQKIRKERKSLIEKGEEMIEKARNEAEALRKRSNKDEVTKKMMEELL